MGSLHFTSKKKRNSKLCFNLPKAKDFDMLDSYFGAANDFVYYNADKEKSKKEVTKSGEFFDNCYGKKLIKIKNQDAYFNSGGGNGRKEEPIPLEVGSSGSYSKILATEKVFNSDKQNSDLEMFPDQSTLCDTETKCSSASSLNVLDANHDSLTPKTLSAFLLDDSSSQKERPISLQGKQNLQQCMLDSLKLPNDIDQVGDKVKKQDSSKLSSSSKSLLTNSQHFNSIFIFDWDDTLLCTSYLSPYGVFDEFADYSDPETKSKLDQLDNAVCDLLSKAIANGDTYIITNSEPNWVEYSADKFYPKTKELLKEITVISARGDHEQRFPNDKKEWKIQAFLGILTNNIDVNKVTNLIILGDSQIEMDAAAILASKFSHVYLKTVKFKECPKPGELRKQLQTVSEQFVKIYTSVKTLTIRVEKKSK